MTNITTNERTISAATRYLERRGYDNITTDGDFIVAHTEEAIVFAKVISRPISEGGFTEEPVSRKDMEQFAIKWLLDASKDVVDIAVRFDVISILILSPERALIRHHLGAFTESDSES